MYESSNPTPFYGYSRESVRAFLDKLQIYFHIKNIPTSRWTGILQTFLQGPARIELESATAVGGALMQATTQDIIIVTARNVGATPAEILAGHEREYELNTAWLLGLYAGAEVQQELQEELSRMRQLMNESLKDFHTRIQHAMQMAYVPDAATNIILQTVFMNGLHEDIRIHVEAQGALTMVQKLNRAQGYFRAHSTKRSFANEISPELRKIIGYDDRQVISE